MQRFQVLSATRSTVRIAFPIIILSACVALLSRQISLETIMQLPQQLANISALQWGAAAIFTLASFFAVAQYDVQAHRALGTGVPEWQARLSGAIGIAIGQTIGFGLVSGAVARWRMLRGASFTQTLKLSTFVSVTFVLAWACVTGLICAILPAPSWTALVSLAAAILLPAVAALLFWRPTLHIGGQTIPLPSLRVAGAILIWALADMVLAAVALWVFLPPGTLALTSLLPLFVIALGCGLISNTPGGIGPFELILVSALPATAAAEPDVLTAIVAFRITYYAAPACLAVLAMMHPLRNCATKPNSGQQWHDLPRSEAQALRQNGGCVETTPSGKSAPIWDTAQTRTLFTDVKGRSDTAVLDWLRHTASKHGRIPLLYKSGSHAACAALRAGWAVLHIADDAIVDLENYDVDAPVRRRLRRKLRAAEKAGVTFRSNAIPPHHLAAQIDTEWQNQCGTARGGSMGRYCPIYISDQWVVSAYSGNRLIAFVSFHQGSREWCLDIMRHGTNTPDGVMHALVHRALLDARATGCRRINLASTPACPDPTSRFWRAVARMAVHYAGGTGLRQFKSAFGPRWVPRYAAAPNWFGLVLALADIIRVVRAPKPLTTQTRLDLNTNSTHQEDENYELASRSTA